MFEDNKISNNSIDEISLIDLTMLLLKRKKLISYIVGSVIILTAIVLILIPNEYQSQASILPTWNRDKFSDLKNLAGIGMMSTNADNSSDLFPVILKSREITSAVLAEKYSFRDGDQVIGLTLHDYFDLESPDKLYKKLLEITDVNMDKKTGVITVGVTTKYPEFSQKIL